MPYSDLRQNHVFVLSAAGKCTHPQHPHWLRHGLPLHVHHLAQGVLLRLSNMLFLWELRMACTPAAHHQVSLLSLS